MSDIKIYSVSDRYISYLRNDPRLKNVFDNKEGLRSHTRKYLGIVFVHDGFNYFIPFSSPKKSDYTVGNDGSTVIRKSIIPIIRMIAPGAVNGEVELKGTLKLSNMIPVPDTELTPYIISEETDERYRHVVEKEWEFIRANTSLITKSARVLFNQKTRCDELYAEKPAPRYLADTIDFLYAEEKCKEFQNL